MSEDKQTGSENGDEEDDRERPDIESMEALRDADPANIATEESDDE
jgi:hypothetical protein